MPPRKAKVPKTEAAGKEPAKRGRPLSSIRAYCEEHGHDRDTVSRKIAEQGLAPAGTERGSPVYREADLHALACAGTDGIPRDPHRRKSYFSSELDRIKLEQMCGELVPQTEVEEEYARLIKVMVQFLDSLPDKLERDCGLPPSVIASVDAWLNDARTELHRASVSEDEEEPVDEP